MQAKINLKYKVKLNDPGTGEREFTGRSDSGRWVLDSYLPSSWIHVTDHLP